MEDMGLTKIEEFQNLLINVVNRNRNQFSEELENMLISELKDLGFSFKDKYKFYSFAKNRISRIVRQDSQIAFYYLDYINEQIEGVLLAITNK